MGQEVLKRCGVLRCIENNCLNIDIILLVAYSTEIIRLRSLAFDTQNVCNQYVSENLLEQTVCSVRLHTVILEARKISPTLFFF